MDGNSSPPSQHGTVDEDQLGFILEVDEVDGDGPGGLLPCRRVGGFQEAIVAAQDPRLPIPRRLVLVSPEVATFDWLAAWSEDDQQVRRTLRIRRSCDGATIIAVVTLAAFGQATHTALTIESLTLPSQGRRVVRSGVHPKSFLASIRSYHRRSLPQATANDVRMQPTDPSNGDAG
jgi:hypothetical protein